MSNQPPISMASTRALLTETDREYITGEAGDDKRYQSASRIRRRIREQLPRDVEILKEHHPDLLDELREAVCEEQQPDDSIAFEEDTDPLSEHDAGRERQPDPPEHVEVDTLVTVDDVPASGKEAEARRQAAVATLELLQDYEESDTSSLKEAAWDAYLDAHGVGSLEELEAVPLDTYAGASNPTRSLWNNSVLDVVKESEYAEKRSDTERRGGYRWVGE